jgi:hypothetical protein
MVKPQQAPFGNRRALLCVAVALLGLVCGAGAPAHAQKHERPEQRRYILGLLEPSDDLKALRKQVRRVAGVPVASVQALSPTQLVVVLRCRSAARCDQALTRLSGATTWVRSVDVDAVRSLPAPVPVAASAAR